VPGDALWNPGPGWFPDALSSLQEASTSD